MNDAILHPKNRFTWSLLAFQGGFINVGGLLTVHIFVSHITGFSALFSAEVFSGHLLKALYFLLVPFFFLAGAFFSSVFTEVRKKKHLPPIYIQILAVLSLSFLAIAILGVCGYFGKFGEPFQSFRDFVLLSILAFSCGSQNAIFTHYSKSIIRTTHLTGIVTDLGIGLAKTIISKDHGESYVNGIRIDLIVSFVLGSLFATYIYPKLEFVSFTIPAMISFIVGARLYFTNRNFKDENSVGH